MGTARSTDLMDQTPATFLPESAESSTLARPQSDTFEDLLKALAVKHELVKQQCAALQRQLSCRDAGECPIDADNKTMNAVLSEQMDDNIHPADVMKKEETNISNSEYEMPVASVATVPRGSRRQSSSTSVLSNKMSKMSSLSSEDMEEVLRVLDTDKRFAASRKGNPMQQAIWRFLTEPDSSRSARLYKEAMNPIFLASVVVAVSHSMQPPLIPDSVAWIVEFAFEVFYLLEIGLRFGACPRKLAFLVDAYNWIDALSVVPLIVRLVHMFGAPLHVTMERILLGMVPILRLLKLLRRFEKFHLLLTAFEVAFEALPVLLYTLCVLALLFTCLVYVFEPRYNIPTLLDGFWLTVVTMSTVGYGDKTPKSAGGHVVVVVLIICSALYMAIPLGIVGNAFNRVWEDRTRLLLMKRTRDRLAQWGYCSEDIPKLFGIFGKKQSGELTFNEFCRMFREMKIGITDLEIFQLFQSFDDDGSGSIDYKEFVHGLYPADYVSMYRLGGSMNSNEEPAPAPAHLVSLPSSLSLRTTGQQQQHDSSFSIWHNRNTDDLSPPTPQGDCPL